MPPPADCRMTPGSYCASLATIRPPLPPTSATCGDPFGRASSERCQRIAARADRRGLLDWREVDATVGIVGKGTGCRQDAGRRDPALPSESVTRRAWLRSDRIGRSPLPVPSSASRDTVRPAIAARSPKRDPWDSRDRVRLAPGCRQLTLRPLRRAPHRSDRYCQAAVPEGRTLALLSGFRGSRSPHTRRLRG